MLIRKANPDEASYLSGLAFRSKAENFYLRMGARRIGDIESTVFPGRKLKLLEIEIRN
ncbi:hypothetical protein L5D93_18090 [Paenibacillus thiaminolyticus]|nr:hypothetical protein [Paenibacillus thiaminolyticus]